MKKLALYSKEEIESLVAKAVKKECQVIRLLINSALGEMRSLAKLPQLTGEPYADEMPINNLTFSTRAKNCFLNMGITTIGQLCKMDATEILKHRNVGNGVLHEIRLNLANGRRWLKNDTRRSPP